MPSTVGSHKKPASTSSKKTMAGRGKATGAAGPSRGRGTSGGSSARTAPRAEAPAKRVDASMGGVMTSKVTERSQTTLPRGVRQVLGIKPGQVLGYVIDDSGVRLVNTSAASHEDPAIRQFLRFLEHHMETAPASAVAGFPADLLARARAATQGVEIDHDAPIDGAIDL